MGQFTRRFFLEKLSKLLGIGYGTRTAVRRHRQAVQEHVKCKIIEKLKQ